MSDTKERLIAVAGALLDAGGPEAVTLREVGRAAGVSHNAPYRHFADKTALLAAIAARELARAGATSERLDPKAMMLGYVRSAMKRPERFRLTFGRWDREDEGLAEAAHKARANFVAAVRQSQARAELPSGDPDRLSALLQSVAHGAADLALAGHLAKDGKGGVDPEGVVEDLFAYLKRAAERERRA